MIRFSACVLAAAVLFGTTLAAADDRADYNRRAAERFSGLFKSLDRDADGTVSRLEAKGDLNFGPRFEDMDIDRNGTVTRAELQRFVGQEFGVTLAVQQ
jgi:Ca2+-binding EF-hand superfamily protein